MKLPATITVLCYTNKDNWSRAEVRLVKAPKLAGDHNALWNRRVVHVPRKAVKQG